jgi:carnitine 3-dehydrogenase
MRQVKTLGLLGTGVIGGGWAARALHFGIDVVARDVRPEMEAGFAVRSTMPPARWRA